MPKIWTSKGKGRISSNMPKNRAKNEEEKVTLICSKYESQTEKDTSKVQISSFQSFVSLHSKSNSLILAWLLFNFQS